MYPGQKSKVKGDTKKSKHEQICVAHLKHNIMENVKRTKR